MVQQKGVECVHEAQLTVLDSGPELLLGNLVLASSFVLFPEHHEVSKCTALILQGPKTPRKERSE